MARPRSSGDSSDQLELGFPGDSPGGGPRRVFLGWEEPILATATRHLCEGARQADGLVDLSATTILVPTLHAGRRLREALAMRAAELGTAVLPPMVTTAEHLVSPERLGGRAVASATDLCVALMSLLLELDLEEHRELFPVDPVERNAAWALRTAEELNRTRGLLGEAGHLFATAAPLLEEAGLESERWRELAKLEAALVERLAACSLEDPLALRRQLVEAPVSFPEGTRLVLAGLADPSPCVARALDALCAGGLPCEVLIQAPASEARAFDRWGRPITEAWLERDIPTTDESLRLAATPQAQANEALKLLKPYGRRAPLLAALGAPDGEVATPLAEGLADLDLGAFDPAGRPMSSHWLTYLLRRVHGLLATDAFEDAAALFRVPELTQAIAKAFTEREPGGERLSVSGLLESLDRLAEDHLPGSFSEALAFAAQDAADPAAWRPEASRRLHEALAWLDGRLKALRETLPQKALPDFLALLLGDRQLDSARTADAELAEVLGLFTTTLAALGSPAFRLFRDAPGPAEELDLLLHLLERESWMPERRAEDIDLLGWLELAWEDAPHLIITGMNEGLVPESIVGHAFLPDSARRLLGLRHNDSRCARDAFLLTAILECRRHRGRVDLILGRVSAQGDPLRPSRLLLARPETELADRVEQLFRHAGGGELPAPWTRTWKLVPPGPEDGLRIFQGLRVTAFRDYLACPLRFYLKHGLGMRPWNAPREELDRAKFGSLLHHALETYGREASLSACEDAGIIADYLLDVLDDRLATLHGRRLTAPLLIQRESARRRLRWWAEHEAASRAEGWRILAVEAPLSDETHPWTIGGLPVTGRLDRVEEHPDGTLRVLDFKTGGKDNAAASHIGTLGAEATVPDWARARPLAKQKNSRWIDLQLPLYILAWLHRRPGSRVVAGYGLLGEAKSEVRLDLWHELDAERLDEARRCAEGVVAGILSRKFWPPSSRLKYDDFRELFFANAEDAVDPRHLRTREDAED